MQEHYLRNNLALLRERWPDIAELVEKSIDYNGVSALQENSIRATLIIDSILIASAYDQRKEAEVQASLIPEASRDAWVYGLGLGGLVRNLLQRKNLDHLHVTLMNPALTHQSLRYFDHSDWLGDSRVELHTASEQTEIHFPFAAVPSCLILANEHSARLRDIVFLELANPFLLKKHSKVNKELLIRLEGNEDFIKGDGDIADLFQSATEKTFFIAAAGPSLGDHYAYIASKRDSVVLIAVDAALGPLLNAGISPDIVICIDAMPELNELFFKPHAVSIPKKITLVYFPIVHQDVLKAWSGQRMTAYSPSELYQETKAKYPKGMLFTSGSVLHPAIDLARKMGGIQLVLFGADFCFAGGLSHVSGSAAVPFDQSNTGHHWVVNNLGDKVSTAPSLLGFLRDLERYIDHYPEITYINASSNGARIKGTLLLEEVNDGA